MTESHHPLAAAGGWSPGGSGGNADASPASYNTTRQRNRRWAIELAARVVGGADLIAKAREILAFVEETPSAD